jgi:beta-glucanase (GH16 family)
MGLNDSHAYLACKGAKCPQNLIGTTPGTAPLPVAAPPAIVTPPVTTPPVTTPPVTTPPVVSVPTVVPCGATATPTGTVTVNSIVYNLGVAQPYSLQTECDGAIQRFEVRQGDHGWSGDAANGTERAEIITANYRNNGLLYPMQQDVWLSFAIKIEKGDAIATNHIIGQLHDQKDPADTIGLSPALSLEINPALTTDDNVNLFVQTRYDRNASTTVQQPWLKQWNGNFPRGEWIYIVLRVRGGYNDNAQLQLWVNGAEQINRDQQNIGYNNPEGFAYWQYGIYRYQDSRTTIVRYANMEQGVDSLLDRAANPLPIPGETLMNPPVVTPPVVTPPVVTPPVVTPPVVTPPVVTPPVVTPTIPPAINGAHLTFHDEFETSSLDLGNWTLDYVSQNSTINNELQNYVPNAFEQLPEGALRINAREQDHLDKHYTSGAITSYGSFAQRYGYFETRMRLPVGKGLWSGFWMLNTQMTWPPEIDVAEAIGEADTVYNTLHEKKTGSHQSHAHGETRSGVNFGDGWHVFAVSWRPDAIIWYVDGTESFRFTGDAVPSDPMYLLFNLAIGGNWPGAPTAETVFPAHIDIDYVRVYQYDDIAPHTREIVNYGHAITDKLVYQPGETVKLQTSIITGGQSSNAPFVAFNLYDYYQTQTILTVTQSLPFTAMNSTQNINAEIVLPNNIPPGIYPIGAYVRINTTDYSVNNLATIMVGNGGLSGN